MLANIGFFTSWYMHTRQLEASSKERPLRTDPFSAISKALPTPFSHLPVGQSHAQLFSPIRIAHSNLNFVVRNGSSSVYSDFLVINLVVTQTCLTEVDPASALVDTIYLVASTGRPFSTQTVLTLPN